MSNSSNLFSDPNHLIDKYGTIGDRLFFAKQWLERGKVMWTSRDKFSFIYSERRANQQWHKLYRNIRSFLKNNHAKGYFLTVNPKKLQYRDANSLNSKIIRYLKNDPKVAIIQKELEDNFINSVDDPHYHYLIVSLHPLNRRNVKRRVKRYGKQTTNSITQTKLTVVNDWKKATSYVTKQYGLPLPLKHRQLSDGSKSNLNQFQEFLRLPKENQMQLLHDWIKDSKGMVRHQTYFNSRCQPAKAFHKKLINKEYCRKHDVLLNASKLTSKQDTTVFGVSDSQLIKRLYPKAHVIRSKHHYSQREHLMQLLHGNIYYHDPKRYQSTSLFS